MGIGDWGLGMDRTIVPYHNISDVIMLLYLSHSLSCFASHIIFANVGLVHIVLRLMAHAFV